MDPQGWTYRATVRPNGGEPFDVPIPSDPEGGVFDLGDGLVFTPSTGITTLETRVKALEDAQGDASGLPENFDESVQDIVGGMIAGAGGTYNDADGTVTLPSGGGGEVLSVAGRTGNVTLSVADLTDASSLATDAELTSGLAGKANTSHTHTSLNITDWAEAVQDTVAAMLTSGANVTLTYDDAAGKVTVTASGGDAELMRDTIGAALVGVSGVSVAVNDAADTITLSISGVTSTQISDFTEATQDVVGAMIAGAGGTYDDAAGTITLPSGGWGGIDTEAVQDVVGAMVAAAGGSYNDTAGTITLPSGGGGGAMTVTAPPGVWLHEFVTGYGNDDDWAYYNAKAHVFFAPNPLRIDALRVYFYTANAGAKIGLGVYDSWPSGRVKNLLSQVAGIPAETVGWVEAVLPTPLDLPAGVYWLASRKAAGGPGRTMSVGASSVTTTPPTYRVGRWPLPGNVLGTVVLGESFQGSYPDVGMELSNRMHPIVEVRTA